MMLQTHGGVNKPEQMVGFYSSFFRFFWGGWDGGWYLGHVKEKTKTKTKKKHSLMLVGLKMMLISTVDRRFLLKDRGCLFQGGVVLNAHTCTMANRKHTSLWRTGDPRGEPGWITEAATNEWAKAAKHPGIWLCAKALNSFIFALI